MLSLGAQKDLSQSAIRDNIDGRAQQPKEELWNATPCTIPYVSTSSSFDRSDRFKLGSIYHRDDVNKPKPVFNDIEKPELLLLQFRREIAEASSDRWKKRNILDRRSS